MAEFDRLQAVVEAIVREMAAAPDRGAPAIYIPRLAAADITRFGICVLLADGREVHGGDSEDAFSIQSIVKVFNLTLALGRTGDLLWRRVGREPSGSPFNSIVLLEQERGLPRNPFINAGALVVSDVILAGHAPREALGELIRFVRYVAEDDSIVVDHVVARSEQEAGDRNQALGHYMRAFGNLRESVDRVLGFYFHACAVSMNCRQLARAGRYLALDGLHPAGGRVISAKRARRIAALMLTCGQYEGSGDFAFRVGLPAKSGVGGGILAIVPGRASVAVWSPGLDGCGNSQLGALALQRLSEAMGWSVFAPSPSADPQK
jgi:glutaminase